MGMSVQLCLLVLAMCLYSTLAAPVDQKNERTDDQKVTKAPTKSEQEDYLRRYYGLEPIPEDQSRSPTALTDHEQAFKDAVRRLQYMANLPQTGVVDEETRKVMALPRCGRSDDDQAGDASARQKRYATLGSKWRRNDLTYNLQNSSPDLPQAVQQSEIARALNVWSEHTPLNFRKIDSSSSDITVLFAKFYHGDDGPFDGEGGELAHAYSPKHGGDVHVDDSERFTAFESDPSGVNLFQVMAHEFGHSLGLDHSNVQSALMAPFYRGYVPDFKLDRDDITGIQSLYGKRLTGTPSPTDLPTQPTRSTRSTTPPSTVRSSTLFTPTPTISTTRSTSPDFCSDGQFDAITLHNGITFAFRGPQFVRLNQFGIVSGFPRNIADRWRLIPNDLDAAFHVDTRRDRSTYFFKGSQVWRFGPNGPITGYPKSIGSEFPGLPNNIDAAFVWSRNQRIYVTKGSLFYRIRPGSGVDAGFPKPLSMWNGLPNKIDAALQWTNGVTYFFSGPFYYRYNDQRKMVDPGFPRRIDDWWLGCPDNLNAKIIGAKNTTMTK